MKRTFLLIYIILLPVLAICQWTTEEPYHYLLGELDEFCDENNITCDVNEEHYASAPQRAQEYVDYNWNVFNSIMTLIIKSQENTQNAEDYSEAVNNLYRITEPFFYDKYQANKEKFIFLYKNPFFKELRIRKKYHIYYLLGNCKLNHSIKKELLSEQDLPVLVRAKLGDTIAQSEVLDEFLTEYLDTINYDRPKEGLVSDLLYLNNEQAFKALDKVLSSKHVVYQKNADEMYKIKVKAWDVISISNYIFRELTSIFRYEIIFVESIIYAPLSEKKSSQVNLFYARKLEEYLEDKFEYDFTVNFKKNRMIQRAIYVPSPKFFDDEEYIKKFVYTFYSFEGEFINTTYEELREQTIVSWNYYHNGE